MFGFDWNLDGKSDLIDDLITLEVLDELEDEETQDSEEDDEEGK